MANAPKNTSKAIRLDDDLWTRAGHTASRMHTDRSTLLRAFLHWYVRDPDARLPQRPDEPEYDERGAAINQACDALDTITHELRKQA